MVTEGNILVKVQVLSEQSKVSDHHIATKVKKMVLVCEIVAQIRDKMIIDKVRKLDQFLKQKNQLNQEWVVLLSVQVSTRLLPEKSNEINLIVKRRIQHHLHTMTVKIVV